jgi:exopolyphosphatase/guanosine-5'-triphosphate,3'-diphosphate pyrophosphatase
MAAIDMGSNSFHMVVARLESGELRLVEKFAEKVMLGAGLDERNQLSDEYIEKALDCLRRFAQRAANIDPRWLRCIGTNTLRRARNCNVLIQHAQKLLNCPVEVVAGREEARLVYLGVSHSLPETPGRRLVFDIGGGSTEFIIGERFEALRTESLHMGCIAYRERFFPNGEISEKAFRRAVMSARREIMTIAADFRELGWSSAFGSSGTVKAIAGAAQAAGLASEGVTADCLPPLVARLLKHKNSADIEIDGIKPDRRSVFPSGLAILVAAFEQLGLERVDYSEGALREGVLYDMLGRLDHENVCERSVQAMMVRYGVDLGQAQRVQQTALQAFDQVNRYWDLNQSRNRDILRWAALMHEIGLTVSHAGFHKHGAYLLQWADLPGFTREEQKRLACLVSGHRRKVRPQLFEEIPEAARTSTLRLTLLLRISSLLHRSRRELHLPSFLIQVKDNEFRIQFPAGWAEEHPLTCGEFQQEQDVWDKLGYRLIIV